MLFQNTIILINTTAKNLSAFVEINTKLMNAVIVFSVHIIKLNLSVKHFTISWCPASQFFWQIFSHLHSCLGIRGS